MAEIGPDKEQLFQLRRDIVFRDLEHTYAMTIELFKWCLSTTLALNGAALVTVLGSDTLRPLLLHGPGWVFVIGIVASLAATVSIILAMAHLGEEFSEAIWRGKAFNEEKFDDFAPNGDDERTLTIGGLFMAASALCFIVGCVWTGISAADLSAAPTTQQVGSMK